MSNTGSERRLESAQTLAAESGLSESMILKLAKTGAVRTFKIGRALRIDRASWEEYLRRCEVGAGV